MVVRHRRASTEKPVLDSVRRRSCHASAVWCGRSRRKLSGHCTITSVNRPFRTLSRLATLSRITCDMAISRQLQSRSCEEASLWRDLPDDAATGVVFRKATFQFEAASRGRSIHVSALVQCHASDRIRTVGCTGEIVKVSEAPAAIVPHQLEYRPLAKRSDGERGAVEISCGVHGQGGEGTIRPGEGMQYGEVPGSS